MSATKPWKKIGWSAGVLGLGAVVANQVLKKKLKFAGKNILIAGATRGLGLVMARHALSLGANVSICGRDEATLDQALQELTKLGNAVGCVCDLTQATDVANWIDFTKSKFASIDVLIYNAGIIQVGPFESMQISDYNEAIQIHLFGALHALQAVLPEMKANGGGSIGLIASMGGKRSVPHMLPYDASKFALVGLGEGLAIELAKDNIFVTTVCPATMRTGSPDNATFKGDHRKEFTWFSLLDSLPGVSVSAEYAARKIFKAISARQSLLIFPWTAKAGVAASALFPELYVRVMREASKLLPRDANPTSYSGRQSHSKLSPSVLTTLTDIAARKNNETRKANDSANEL